MTDPDNNPIGFLQEMCQKHGFRFPQYEDLGSSGPDHCREFKVRCTFEGLEALGTSRQKKQAKSEAAKAIVALLKESDHDIPNLKSEPVALTTTEKTLTSSASKNPISAINEYCQANRLPAPEYKETSVHGNNFVCECHVNHQKTYGHGSNKKTAKTEAALKMCLQFNINCIGRDLVEESNTYEDIEFSKNCISLLQEKCAINHQLKNLEYFDLPPQLGHFMVRCTLNSLSCDGSGTSKKNAKHEAARKMLLALQNQNSDNQRPAVLRLSENLNTDNNKSNALLPVHKYELEDFNLSDEERNEERTVVDVDLSLGLEELSLGSKHELKEEKSGEVVSKGIILRKNASSQNRRSKEYNNQFLEACISLRVPPNLTVRNINLNVTHHAHFPSNPNTTQSYRSRGESSSSRTHKTKTSESLARWAGQDENPS